MKVERNSRGAFISHDGLTIFFNDDGIIRVTKRDESAVFTHWSVIAEMKADKESIGKLAELLL